MEREILSVGGRLVLINLVLTSLAMFMLSFFQIPRGVLKNWITIAPDFSSNVMNTRRNIDWLGGTSFVHQDSGGLGI